ncbi:hypothetical protein CYMTET_43389, partial [Cymbomonas tetramitiformis]
MGKGGTKFEGDQIGHRAGRSRAWSGKAARDAMFDFQRTGYHPCQEDEHADDERAAYDDGQKLPHRNAKRECVFLSISHQDEHVGHLSIELYEDLVPIAARTFRLLCTGAGSDGVTAGACYRGSEFHKLRL